MTYFLVGLCTFFISTVLTFALIYCHKFYDFLSDNDTGIQKYHLKRTPRVGGVAIFLSFVIVSLVAHYWFHIDSTEYSVLLIPATVLIFLIGVMEDIFKNISPKYRLFIMLIAALIAIYVVKVCAQMQYTNFSTFTLLLQEHPMLSIVMTLFFIVGSANCFNIIDGYHGLSTTVALINYCAVGIIANKVGDYDIVFVVILMLPAIVGFLIFNYPLGKIFLGDGGAYILGFVISVISIQLQQSHHQYISAYSLLLINMYPITEMAFSIIRRKLVHKTKITEPDNRHLHQLVYSMLPGARNAFVMPAMLALIVPQVVVGIRWYNNTAVCLTAMIIYFVAYVILYMILHKILRRL